MVKVVVPRKCSICKTTGHNRRTCGQNNNKEKYNVIKLFGVKIKRGSRNLNPSHGNHDHKSIDGEPWSLAEHRLFLTGLQALGNGQWKRIAKDYVTTRTPKQVITHAQNYYLRLKTPVEMLIRPSIFDAPLEKPIIAADGNGLAVPSDQADMYLLEGQGPYPASSASSTVIEHKDEIIDGSPSTTLLDLELRLG